MSYGRVTSSWLPLPSDMREHSSPASYCLYCVTAAPKLIWDETVPFFKPSLFRWLTLKEVLHSSHLPQLHSVTIYKLFSVFSSSPRSDLSVCMLSGPVASVSRLILGTVVPAVLLRSRSVFLLESISWSMSSSSASDSEVYIGFPVKALGS